MRKEIQFNVPKDYSAVSLKKYLLLQDDLKNYEGDTDAQTAFLLYHLCGLTPEVIVQLDVSVLGKIKSDLDVLLNRQDFPLQRSIKIGEVEYGFEPNLGEMPYGAYLDLSKFETLSIDKNWATVMSILYRPIINKAGALYEIKGYGGVEEGDEDKWLEIPMDFHFGTFFFFNRIYKDLLNGILKSLTEEVSKGGTQHPHLHQILQESGEAIKVLQSLQERTYSSLMK
jgi:hypothetical protein